ncbi:hypothetical protein MNBD_GAMMA23-606 [hydrothermal vent metagenome]|uniref:Rieske domain-containing protein n=1 Tax=hydrothermal vent metagenome TaxID=652676 RepID=A0A3B1ACD7_9ZZZZ
MSELIKISEVGSLNAPQCLTLDIPIQNVVRNSPLEVLLVCYGDNQLAAYLNQCPHTGVNLNWQPDQCFDFELRYLACSLHGALFQPADGVCIYGPCRGQSLQSVPLIIKADGIFIDIEAKWAVNKFGKDK